MVTPSPLDREVRRNPNKRLGAAKSPGHPRGAIVGAFGEYRHLKLTRNSDRIQWAVRVVRVGVSEGVTVDFFEVSTRQTYPTKLFVHDSRRPGACGQGAEERQANSAQDAQGDNHLKDSKAPP